MVSVDVKHHVYLVTLEEEVGIIHRAEELCERRGGRPGLPVPNSPYNGLCGREATLNNSPSQHG